MKIKKWKEVKPKEKGIILFTILSILLIVGVFFYQSFAIFKANTNQDMIEGNVENMGDLEFAFYINGELSPTAPKKGSEYSFDSSSSKCIDVKTGNQLSNIVWNDTRWSAEIKEITNTKTKCFLNFKTIYKETTLNGAIPDLGNGRLIPIKISETEKPSDVANGTGGKVTKASITDEWYNYKNKQWANAVILKDESKTYQDNEEIPESNIESYFVWIPRFEYQLWIGEAQANEFTKVTDLNVIQYTSDKPELNNVGKNPISIRFVSKDQEIHNGNTEGSWLTHPAFVSFNTNGMWVSKFETSKKENSNTDSIDPDAIQVIPGVTSWRSIKLAHAFYTTYNYKRELDSHLMKNMEWGAVAYFTNSIYGRCTNNNCEEVRPNNNSQFITGSSAVNAPTCGGTGTNEPCNKYGNTADVVTNYFDRKSIVSSTTGNYTGIYDMSGGAWEFVMGIMLDEKDQLVSGSSDKANSNFVGTLTNPSVGDNPSKLTWTKEDGGLPWPESQYYDTYKYKNNNQQFQRGILGDGTKELGPFYSLQYQKGDGTPGYIEHVGSFYGDLADFATAGSPWFIRGMIYHGGTMMGIGAFHDSPGKNDGNISFRIVLTP